MKKYVKKINDIKVYKTSQEIVITKDGMCTYNPTEEMVLADGWEEYVVPVYEETIEGVRQDKKDEIEAYDQSLSVNEFFIQGISVWLDKNTRVGLRLRFESELAMGKVESTLWYDGECFPIKLEDGMKMLYALEVYASMCYDNTQKHLSIVDSLSDMDAIKKYDYKANYPDKLHF